MTVVGELAGSEQPDLSVEVLEEVAVGLADVVVVVVEPVDHGLDGIGWVVSHVDSVTDDGHVKLGYNALPGHFPDHIDQQPAVSLARAEQTARDWSEQCCTERVDGIPAESLPNTVVFVTTVWRLRR
ncbi:hypothetical protein GCM10009067_28030 [Haloarcula sebkhae]|uniref:Uncharacterized protein n=1 Tax=Haloarcula sebkhae TaxID=932660 RepID=A0A830ETA0_9EURY|nr:hypothetical protein GCM10009067_28030 [Haloarcula sebkhae]